MVTFQDRQSITASFSCEDVIKTFEVRRTNLCTMTYHPASSYLILHFS